MRKLDRMDVIRIMFVLTLLAGIGLAMGSVGRFIPTHKIVEPVYCGSCHPEQVEELNETTHLADFAERIERNIENTRPDIEVSAARYISGGCQMCHNYWDNFKWFGLKNVTVDIVESDNPSLGRIQSEGEPTDIYGNAVSPYGLASTNSYIMNVTGRQYKSGLYPDDPGGVYPGEGTVAWNQIVLPWPAGLDVYKFNTTDGSTYYRLDWVWSKLSSLSPGPVGFQVVNVSQDKVLGSCGTAEKGMCHAAADAVSLSFLGYKREFPEYPNNATGGEALGFPPGYKNLTTLSGSGTFFQHEMAFTTAQYAAKQVKICGACHVFKLPPMRWGGEPWAVKDVWDFANKDNPGYYLPPPAPDYVNDDPFGFRPTYNDLTGDADVDTHVSTRVGQVTHTYEKEFKVRFRTPDWAHANIVCIRCHVHAGINDKTVAGEIDITYKGTPTPTPLMPSPGSSVEPSSEYTQEP